MQDLTKEDIESIISKIKDLISWAEYDYEMSDIPGFRDPVDKRQDTAIINQATNTIQELNKLKELI